MGLFKKMKEAIGAEDGELMQNGVLGRGLVLGMDISGTTLQRGNAPVERVCTFVLEVRLDDTPAYQVQTRKRIPEYALAQIQPGHSVVAVRVDPNDHNRVAIDLTVDPPEVRMAAQPGELSAADVLAQGSPCQAVIIQYEPLGMKNPGGLEMYAFLLTIMVEGVPPYQIQVGNPVPEQAIPLLFPGSRVPAKYIPGAVKEEVVIDWNAALASSA